MSRMRFDIYDMSDEQEEPNEVNSRLHDSCSFESHMLS